MVAFFFYAAWEKARSDDARWGAALTLVLGLFAVAVWPLSYYLRARITLPSGDMRMVVRGRVMTQVIDGSRIRSAILYGQLGNQAVAYLDSQDRRLLTLRLIYWSLADVRRLSDHLGVWLDEPGRSARRRSPGRGLFPFMENHRSLVGAMIPVVAFVATVVAALVWIKLG